MKTAAEIYSETQENKRHYVFSQISSAAQNCHFNTQIYRDYMTASIIDELRRLGYDVDLTGNNNYIIRWENPKFGSPNDIA